jgi:uncharacterized protein (DUF2235 family)
MTRNIVICCDGTSNEFGSSETNVVRLLRVLDRSSVTQTVYYDPGVGTLPDPFRRTQVGKFLSLLPQLALGIGLIGKVEEAYTYLMNYAEPGDQVFLFGFSRGAYTVRVLAGLLHMLGLLPKGNEHLIPYAVRYYKSIRGKSQEAAKRQWQICDSFRHTFSRSTGHDRRFPVHFLGVWDTVSSVGWFWEPASFPYTSHNPSVQRIWHGVSIDEHRAFFRSNLFRIDSSNPKQVLDQRWFPGDHCDVGGGHVDGGLWRSPFKWMVDGAKTAGLEVVDDQTTKLLNGAIPPFRRWDAPHDTLRGWWRCLEYVPKKTWDARTQKDHYQCNRYRRRFIPDGAVLDSSTLYCMKENGYRPMNCSVAFINRVLSLEDVPESIPYQRA